MLSHVADNIFHIVESISMHTVYSSDETRLFSIAFFQHVHINISERLEILHILM